MDVLSKKQRSYCMSQVKSKNTKLEDIFRIYILSRGIKGYRIGKKNIVGKPDLYFGKYKVAVFIDGCFWHKCPVCLSIPSSNSKFWEEKLAKNLARDKKVNDTLRSAGIKVVRLWGHEIKKDIDKCYRKLVKELAVKE